MNSIQSSIANLKEFWKDDLKAGFNVSLIALPLSLGIALGSGFPPIAGIFAAIIGGLFVSRINGSFITIVGPAAGLIVVNLSAIEVLGQGDNVAGYKYALSAIFIAGLFISLMGFIKAGKLGDFFPTSAVHGMLAAIGVIIMVKQLFVAVAVRAHGHEFYEILEEIPVAIKHANPEVVIITLVSLAILILYPKIDNKIIKASWVNITK
jgi:MFS superfamily sulfate permease-like transporter